VRVFFSPVCTHMHIRYVRQFPAVLHVYSSAAFSSRQKAQRAKQVKRVKRVKRDW